MTFYKIAKGVVTFFLRLFFRWKVSGNKKLPADKPVILVANHISNYDPLVVGCAVDRQVHFLAKEEIFKLSVLGFIVKKLGSFPIKRGGNDRKAIKSGLKLLEENKVLGVFPEGTRSKDGKIGKGLSGAALFALKSDAVVIPIGILSSYKISKPIYVKIGEPIDLDKYRKTKLTSEDLTETMDYIMDKIKEQVEKINE